MRKRPLFERKADKQEVKATKGKKYDVMVCENCKQEVVITSECKKSGAGEGELYCCGSQLIRKTGG